MMEPPAEDLDTDAAIDPERRGSATPLAPAQHQAPADQQHAPGYQHHAPGYQQHAPGYQQHAPGYQQHAPGYQQHAPGYQQQAPGYQQHAPRFQQHAPGYQQQAPGYQQHAPGYQHHAPGYQQQAPADQHHAPGYQQQAPADQQHAPGYQQQAPAGYQPSPHHQFQNYQPQGYSSHVTQQNPQGMPPYQNSLPTGKQTQQLYSPSNAGFSYPSLPYSQIPLSQRVTPVRHPNFTGVQPTIEHYDVAIAFAKGDEEIADDIMTKMSNLELHNGTKPKVCLSDESQFSANKVTKAEPIVKVCTLIYVLLTKNLTEDVAATLLKDEAIGMTRLAPKHEQDEQRRYCVRPLHTLSEEERKGVYTVPCGLHSVDSLDWYKFGKPYFNKRLVKTLEYYLPYRRHRESLDSSGRLTTANDLKTAAAGVATINQGNPSARASSAFQQTGHSYQHPYVSPPTHQATTPNQIPSGHSPSNSNTQGHGGAFSVPPNISSHQQGVLENQRGQAEVVHQESAAGSTATGGPSQTSDDHSMRHQPKEEASATSNNNLSNTTQAFSQTAQLRNQANNNQFQKPSTSHSELQEVNQHSGTGNQSQDPSTDRHHVGSRGSLTVHQTPDSEGENVSVSTHSARVDDSEQPRRSSQDDEQGNVDQEMPNSNLQTNDPQLSDLPTEVDKDSGMVSLSTASLRTEAASEKTESCSGQPSTASVDGDCSMTSSQRKSSSEKQSCPPTLAEFSERTPGDGQDFEDQPDKYDKSKVTSSSTCVPKKLSRRSSDDDDISPAASELRVTSSGPAYRSVKCGSPNGAHLEQGIKHTDIPRPPQVVHHFHHLAHGHYDDQSNDPNLFLPDHLLRDFTPFRVPDAGYPRVRSTPARQDRIGERNVTLEPTAPINIVNCRNVQIGQGQIFERPEPDIALEHQETDDSSLEADVSAEPPPPYSQHDPSQGSGTESPSTNVKQVVHGSQASPAGPARDPQGHGRVDSVNPTLAGTRQTVDQTTRVDRQPTGTQQQSAATGPHGEENLPPAEPSGQDHTGMIQDCAPSMPMASGRSIDLMNQGEGRGRQSAMSELEASGHIPHERRLQLKRGCPDMSDPDHGGHQPPGDSGDQRNEQSALSELMEIESFKDDATSFSVSLPDDGRDLFEFMKNP